MARGWESKSIEEQIGAAESKKESRTKQALTPSEIERRRRRDGLLQERSRIVRLLEGTHNERYRALLERTREHVESELAKFDRSQSELEIESL